MLNLRVKKLDKEALVPTRNNPTDAGLDLYALESTTLFYNEKVKIRTGIAIAVPDGHVGLIFDRSSVGSKGICRLAGVIDSGYRGEVQVLLAFVAKHDTEIYHIHAGDKIAQLIIVPIPVVEVNEVNELDSTDRNDKGFGSSGR